MKKVNLLLGRFQPITKGHIKCIDASPYPTVLCIIRTKKQDSKHPFPTEFLVDLYNQILKDYFIEVVMVDDANPIHTFEKLLDKGYQVTTWTCGTDRVKDYNRLAGYYEKAGLPEKPEVIEIKRSDDDISATQARKCLIGGDKQAFYKLFPDIKLKYSLTLKEPVFEQLKRWIDLV